MGSVAHLSGFSFEWAHLSPQSNYAPSDSSVAIYIHGLHDVIYCCSEETSLIVSHGIACFHFTPALTLTASSSRMAEGRPCNISYVCKAPSSPVVCIRTNNREESQWYQISSFNSLAVSMPLNINRVKLEICWCLSTTTLHGGESPQDAGMKLQVSPGAKGSSPDEGNWGK